MLWLIHMCAMTHSSACLYLQTGKDSRHTYECVMSHVCQIWMVDSRHTYEWVMSHISIWINIYRQEKPTALAGWCAGKFAIYDCFLWRYTRNVIHSYLWHHSYVGLYLENWCLNGGQKFWPSSGGFRRIPKVMSLLVCPIQQHTTFQKKTHGTPPPCVLLCLKWNNIEIRPFALESWAIHQIEQRTCVQSILHLQNPDEFEEGVHIKFLLPDFVCWHYFCFKPQKRPVPVQMWNYQGLTNMWWDLFIYVKRLIYVCIKIHDSFICVTWLIQMCDMTHSYVWHAWFICVTWLIQMCDMTHSYVWQDSFMCVTWLIHMRDMSHSYVQYDSIIRVTWLIHMRDMSHSYVRHDSIIRVTQLIRYHSASHTK